MSSKENSRQQSARPADLLNYVLHGRQCSALRWPGMGGRGTVGKRRGRGRRGPGQLDGWKPWGTQKGEPVAWRKGGKGDIETQTLNRTFVQ